LSGATGSGFRARAGTLTLGFLTSSESPESLLGILESALSGGLLGPPDDDSSEEPDYEAYDEYEDEEWGGDPELDLDIDVPMQTTTKGSEAVYVAFTLARWPRNCPDGPRRVGQAGGDAIAALICGWSATVTHSLGGPPSTLAS
jgi:hypothetical protein